MKLIDKVIKFINTPLSPFKQITPLDIVVGVTLYCIWGAIYHLALPDTDFSLAKFVIVAPAASVVFLTGLLVYTNNEMKTLFSFLAVIFLIFFALILYNYEFFGIIVLLVYAGVISVLVLFIVMSSKIPPTNFAKPQTFLGVNSSWRQLILYISAVYLVIILFSHACLHISALWPMQTLLASAPNTSNSAYFFAKLLPLYDEFFIVFLVIAGALLVALVGALVITQHTRGKTNTK